MHPSTAILRNQILALGAAALLAACSGSPSATAPSRVSPGPNLVVGTADTCNTGTAHDLYAANGLACATCHQSGQATTHGADWMAQAAAGFHGGAANAAIASCQGCHGPALDGVGGSTTVSCAACHGAAWRTDCTMCHGEAGSSVAAKAAPPRATWGNGADPIRVGAHQAHLEATHGLAAPVSCGACHVVPAEALSVGHVTGGTAEVAFSGAAVQGITGVATWSRPSATCANTYCHGATVAGGAQKAPVWTTLDGSQRGCGSCHGAPPSNAEHGRTDLDCGVCHPGYTSSTVNQATHLDGQIDYEVTCTSCHGNGGNPATLTNIAPPRGSGGETATTTLAVGAHTQHLVAANMQVANPFSCDACHVLPVDQLHANGPIDLTFGSLANYRPTVYVSPPSGYYTGTTTAATTTSITDSSKSFSSSVVNKTLYILSGTAAGQTRTVTARSRPGSSGSYVTVSWSTSQPITGLGSGVQYQIGSPGTPIAPPPAASWNRTTAKCSNTWCHGFSGTATNLRGYPFNGGTTATNFTSPTWTTVNGTQDTCTGCHGGTGTTAVYPPTGRHTSESRHRVVCSRCHGGTYTTTAADKSLHINGVIELVPNLNWNAATRSCSPSGCHGSESW